MNKTAKTWLAGGVAACLLLLAVGYFLVVKPKKDDVSAKQTEVTTLAAEDARLQIQLNQLQDRNKQLTQKQIELKKIAERIPADPALPKLIRRLQNDAKNSDVNLLSIAPTTPLASKAYSAGAAPYQEISLSLEVHGTYASLREWFSHLEDADKRLIVVEQVSLKGPDPAKASGTTVTVGTDGIPESPNVIAAIITARTFFTSAATTTPDAAAVVGGKSSATTS